MKIIIATIKTWNIEKAMELKAKFSEGHEIKIISCKEDLNYEAVSSFEPDYIFFPHWSYIIPANIYGNYSCIVFHMTDLPFGRGGSPLQNLIVRGFKETKLSAIRVEKDIDAGAVYLKAPLSLAGSAEEIFRRAAVIIFDEMIPLFIEKGGLEPAEQQGIPVFFKRRTAEQSEINESMSLEEIYDYIRMLDAEGYPNAYIIFGKHKLKFKKARFDGDKICAEVHIMEERQ